MRQPDTHRLYNAVGCWDAVRTIMHDHRMNVHSQFNLRRCTVVLRRLDEEAVVNGNRKWCQWCRRYQNNPVLYGNIYSLGQVTVHYFCLLHAQGVEQKGEDTEGIFGFLEPDIKRQIFNVRKVKCCYCDESGASIKCALKMCKKVFHLPCGIENGSQNNFFGRFDSFCKQHRPHARVSANIWRNNEPVVCAICLEEAKKDYKCIKVLWARCCKKNAWMHRLCVQKYALSSGYYFKCPRCNDKPTFKDAMLNYGIYVPETDASWELEGNQFEALYQRHSRCDAELCLCPEGRQYNEESTNDWEILLCLSCASQGIHVGCREFKIAIRDWYCTGCKPIIQKHRQDAEKTAASMSGPSANSNTIPPVAEAPEESSAVVERQITAAHPENPQSFPDAQEIIVLPEEEEIDIVILDEVPRPAIEPVEEIQKVHRLTTNTPSGGSSSAKPKRSEPRFAIILDDETDDDFEPEIVEVFEDLALAL
ncbi:PHD finger protein 7-like isoform X2 [Neocloeon triangulifer]|uniref:PHD finger protein 7-like isoform X2 n=1 Tax=Neocloeon triangulifer TaxID=2078957 RepID=UPI00286F0683|nr:PHD finger protein 7-like isoform X2 [Neocloeon triangulifer]